MVKPDESQYLTVPEAARLLKVNPSTVWRWIQAEKLPAFRVGPKSIRVKRADLDALIKPVRLEQKSEPMVTRHYGGRSLSGEDVDKKELLPVVESNPDREGDAILAQMKEEILQRAREKGQSDWKEYIGRVVSPEELARRQAVIEKILALREKCNIAPMTSAQLVRKARRTEMRMYDRGR